MNPAGQAGLSVAAPPGNPATGQLQTQPSDVRKAKYQSFAVSSHWLSVHAYVQENRKRDHPETLETAKKKGKSDLELELDSHSRILWKDFSQQL